MLTYPMDTLLLAFIGVAIGLIVTPGADFAVVVRNSLYGSQLGLATAAGVIGGLILHTSLAVVGLAAVLAATPTLFAALTVASGCYLLYLGVRTLIGCVRHGVHRSLPSTVGSASDHQTTLNGIRQGFLTNALNPKAPILFLMLLPQFIAPGSPSCNEPLF